MIDKLCVLAFIFVLIPFPIQTCPLNSPTVIMYRVILNTIVWFKLPSVPSSLIFPTGSMPCFSFVNTRVVHKVVCVMLRLLCV